MGLKISGQGVVNYGIGSSISKPIVNLNPRNQATKMMLEAGLRSSELSPAVKWTIQRFNDNGYFSKINAVNLKVLQSLTISSLVCRIHAEKIQGEEVIHRQLAAWLPGRTVIELETYLPYLPQGTGVDVEMLLRRFLKAKTTAKKATTKKGRASEAAASTNDWSGAQIFTVGKQLSSYCVNNFNIHWKKALPPPTSYSYSSYLLLILLLPPTTPPSTTLITT